MHYITAYYVHITYYADMITNIFHSARLHSDLIYRSHEHIHRNLIGSAKHYYVMKL